jgi:hypothetical protein
MLSKYIKGGLGPSLSSSTAGELALQLSQLGRSPLFLRLLCGGWSLGASLHSVGESGRAQDAGASQPGLVLNLVVGGDDGPVGRLRTQASEMPADGDVGRGRRADEAYRQAASVRRLRGTRCPSIKIDSDWFARARAETAQERDELRLVVRIVEAEPNGRDQVVTVDQVRHTASGLASSSSTPAPGHCNRIAHRKGRGKHRPVLSSRRWAASAGPTGSNTLDISC